MADIFDEVDEEVRKDQYSEVWKKYGNWIIAGAVLALAVSVGYVQWQNYLLGQKVESSAQFQQALRLIDAKKNDEANRLLGDLAESGTDGYSVLARFRAAGLKSESGDRAAAGEIYAALAANSGLDPLYRDLAKLYSIMQRIDDGDPAQLVNELQPLLSADGAWRFSARELAAVLALRQKDTEGAKKHFKVLTDDPTAPAGLRRRASEMLQAIDGR